MKKILVKFRYQINRYRTSLRKKPKIFVIGFNKTGTTSIQNALKEFDIIVANQREAELLTDKVIKGNFIPLFAYCKSAEAFQDVPFSKPEIFKLLDKQFPNSKFILSVRDNSEQWFNSLIKFQSKLFGRNGNAPTKEDLMHAKYVYPGWIYKIHTWTFGTDLFNKEKYIGIYEQHNEDVKTYFANRPNDLLVINVSQPESYKKFCLFIGKKPNRDTFEWKNKTSELSK